MKKLVYLLLFLVAGLQAQELQLIPSTEHPAVRWMILQKLEGGEVYYIYSLDSIPPEDARFDLTTLPYGEYAVQYDADHQPGVRFIHNGEDITMRFDPLRPERPYVLRSGTNKTYYDYLAYNRKIISRLRRFKRDYEKNPSPQLQQEYAAWRQSYNRHTDSLLDLTRGGLLWHFIKGKKEVLPRRLYETRREYAEDALQHYFDEIDLNDTVLYNSHVLYDRLEEYLFRIPYEGYGKAKSDEYIKRLRTIFDRMHYLPSRISFLKTLMAVFALEDEPAKKYLESLYEKLPDAVKSEEFAEQLNRRQWPVRGSRFNMDLLKQFTGKGLSASPYHLVIFYSSDCPHCRRQLPALYKWMTDRKVYDKINVLAVGLEQNPLQWKSFITPFKKWKNTYITPEIMMDAVTAFGVEYTPTYFVLDKNFTILEKTTGGDDIYKILEYFLNHEK